MAQSDTNTAKFVLLIATGSSVSEAAKKARISRSTAHRLMKNEKIQSDICQCRRKCLDEASGKLVAVTSEAAQELAKLIKHKDPQIRLRAIRLLFDSYLKISERESLEQRLHILEKAAHGSNQSY